MSGTAPRMALLGTPPPTLGGLHPSKLRAELHLPPHSLHSSWHRPLSTLPSSLSSQGVPHPGVDLQEGLHLLAHGPTLFHFLSEPLWAPPHTHTSRDPSARPRHCLKGLSLNLQDLCLHLSPTEGSSASLLPSC